MNKEQKEFAISIARRIENNIVISDDNINVDGKIYTYEEFVSEFFDVTRDAKVGMLKITNGVIKVALPTKESIMWMNYDGMQHKNNHSGFTIIPEKTEIDALYGLTNLSNGYFSPYGRVKLYDKSWKKIELSIDEIAEKFGVKPEQIRIKK